MSHNTGSLPYFTHFKRNRCGSPQQGFFEGQGGAFYNRGDIVVDGESYFSLNEASVSCWFEVALVVMLVPPALVFLLRQWENQEPSTSTAKL